MNNTPSEYTDEFYGLFTINGYIEMLENKLWELTKDIYYKKHQEYADKLQLLEIELFEHREADYEYQTTVSTVISVARRAKDIFENCSEPMQKRAFLMLHTSKPNCKGREALFFNNFSF